LSYIKLDLILGCLIFNINLVKNPVFPTFYRVPKFFKRLNPKIKRLNAESKRLNTLADGLSRLVDNILVI